MDSEQAKALLRSVQGVVPTALSDGERLRRSKAFGRELTIFVMGLMRAVDNGNLPPTPQDLKCACEEALKRAAKASGFTDLPGF